MSIQVVVLYPMFHHVPLHLIIYEGFFKKWGIPKNKGFYCNIYKNGLLQIIDENCWLQVRCNYPQLLKTNQKTNAILLGGDVCVCVPLSNPLFDGILTVDCKDQLMPCAITNPCLTDPVKSRARTELLATGQRFLVTPTGTLPGPGPRACPKET